MTDAAAHAFRHHAFARETIWRLNGNGLVIQSDRETTRLPLAQVAEFRVAYDPTRVALDRYRCDLLLADGRKLTLLNKSFVSFAVFESRNATYGPFVRALAAAVHDANPDCRFRVGKGMRGYVATIIFLIAVLVVLFWVLGLTAGMPLSWIVIAKLTFFVVMLPFAISYFRKNRPRPFDPKAVPDALLPIVEPA